MKTIKVLIKLPGSRCDRPTALLLKETLRVACLSAGVWASYGGRWRSDRYL
ncbi:hypothetical protein VB735_23695 [Halotia wernerae UHCC 0503]|nr:hypothetical protein [Halotia wernerae UHCC 0503]